jgi:hypoxanthine phosphoribosyltransferase
MEMTPLITEERIAEAVERLASEIRRDYAGKRPLLIGCLTGSFMFMADLVRRIGLPLECDFMKVSSYEDRTTAGEIALLLDNTLPVAGRDVLLVEDIVDTGASLQFIRERLAGKRPGSLATCVLLYKESPRVTIPKGEIDYLGIAIPDVFVVGYGIDYAQRYRELPFIGAMHPRRPARG